MGSRVDSSRALALGLPQVGVRATVRDRVRVRLRVGISCGAY